MALRLGANSVVAQLIAWPVYFLVMSSLSARWAFAGGGELINIEKNLRSNLVCLSVYLIVVVLSLGQFWVTIESSAGLDTAWSASHRWIESANCARLSGVLLAGCVNGEIVPYAELSLADDVGHALLLGMYALSIGRDIELDHASGLNVVLNFVGLYVLVVLLYSARLRTASFIVLLLGSIVCGNYIGANPHTSLIGITCLAAILPLAIIFVGNQKPSFRIWLVVGVACLALTVLMRQSIGLMGIAASTLLLLIVYFFPFGRPSRPVFILAVLCAIFIAGSATNIVLALRDYVWSVPATTLIDRHGVQHNLFIGLGVVPNSFGVEWSDGFGLLAAQRVNPDVEYVSTEYYEILGSEYLRLLHENPLEVSRIYLYKGGIFLTRNLDGFFLQGIPFGFTMLFAIVISFLARGTNKPLRSADGLLLVSLIFILMYLAQAMVIHPSMQYGNPVEILLILIFGASASYFREGDALP
jgi:hypothetical protein